MDKELKFIQELSDGSIVFFPASIGGGGCGYDVARASPVKHPYWNIEVHHEGRKYFRVWVGDDPVRLALLKLPRMRH